MKRLCLIVLFLIVGKAFSQTTPPPEPVTITQAIPASADAAALGKFGKTPVSFYTGIPDISIPLYTVKSGDLTLPISINYHGGGIKVEEQASSVGLGWALNAGGAITRTVRGKPDEDQNGFLSRISDVANIISGLSSQNQTVSADADVRCNWYADGTYDSEADVFNFNFAGYSGQFEFSTTYGIITSPLQDIKFSYYESNNILYSFTATTPDGVQYVFGTVLGTNGIESSVVTNQHNSGGHSYNMSWMLTQIISPLGHQINFTYSPESYTQSTPVQTAYNIVSGPEYSGTTRLVNDNYSQGSSSGMHTQKLTGITFENGSIKVSSVTTRLDQGGGTRAIDTIAINAAGFSKSYTFHYTNTSSTRLRLDSLIAVLDPHNSAKKEKYTFTYNADPWSTSSNFLYSQDWWGYYNGSNNAYLFPAEPAPNSPGQNLFGGDRTPNTAAMSGAMLTRITYPTAGHTDYTFEPNQVYTSGYNPNDYIESDQQVAASDNPNIIYYNAFMQTNPNHYMHLSWANNPTVQIPITLNAGGFGSPKVQAKIYKKDAQGGYTNYIGVIAPGTNQTMMLDQGDYQVVVNALTNYTDSVNNPGSFVSYYYNLVWRNYTLGPGPHYHGIPSSGMRIAKIADYDGIHAQPYNVRRYTYNSSDTTSSGYQDFVQNYDYDLTVYSVQSGATIASLFHSRTATSNYPLATQKGSPVGYFQVQEYIDNNGQKGKNEYFYTNQGLTGGGGTGFPFIPATEAGWHLGLLSHQINWKQLSNGTYAKVQEKANTYTQIQFKTSPSLKLGFSAQPLNYSQAVNWIAGGNNGSGPGQLVYQIYNDFTDFTYLSSDTSWVYDSVNPANVVRTWNNYRFDANTYQLNRTQTLNSKNERITHTILYPGDAVSVVRGASYLHGLQIDNYPIEEITQKQALSGDTSVRTVAAVLTSYKTNKPFRDSVFVMRSVTPLTDFHMAYSGNRDSRYQPVVSFDKYDAYGNILQEKRVGDAAHTYIWGYKSPNAPFNLTYPIAEVINADSANIAYTNFESYNSTGLGNWVYSNSNVSTDATAPMGPYYFTVSSTATISKTGLTTGTKYMVSFWSKSSGSAVTVSGGSGSTVTNTFNGNAKSGWIYHEYTVTGASLVTITSTGTGQVDELRLYPVNAQMSTYTYVPLVGIASKCDPRNNIVYYNFDNVGRLVQVQDQNRSILKDYYYNYATQGPIWTDDNTTQCVKDNYGNNTGEEQMEQIDSNPYSSTYGAHQWRSMGTQAGACPVPTVYVKLKTVSTSTSGGATTTVFEIDAYNSSTFTTTLTLGSATTVTYAQTTTGSGYQPVTVNHTATIPANANHVQFSVITNSCSPLGGSGYTCSSSVGLQTGAGYITWDQINM
jgi:hypothetical protein